MEITSAEELAVYVPSEAMRGVARLDHLAEKRMETSPMKVTGKDPINTLDSEESALEEDPEPADDLHNINLDERGEDQPCTVGTAADLVMDPQTEDPEPADDLRDVILDERGEDQPCPAGTAADLVMDPQAEDPELTDDLHDIILDERGEDQPCPVGTAASSVMDPQVEVVTSTPSPDAATLPTEEALG